MLLELHPRSKEEKSVSNMTINTFFLIRNVCCSSVFIYIYIIVFIRISKCFSLQQSRFLMFAIVIDFSV